MRTDLLRLHELRKLRFTDKDKDISIRISVTVEPRADLRFWLLHKVVAVNNKTQAPLALVLHEGDTARPYPTAEEALAKVEPLLAQLILTYNRTRIGAGDFAWTVDEAYLMGQTPRPATSSPTGYQSAVPSADRL
jgi:hypothetical protein